MLLSFRNYFIQRRFAKRVFEHCFYLIILLILIPLYYYYELYVVLPGVVEEGTLPYFVHLFLGHFLLVNIVGNMIYGMFTNTSINGKMSISDDKIDWAFCEVCEKYRPPRAWHCSSCNTCILKRDHHCTFLACCVGYYNHRYFLMFTFYIFVAMIYALFYNVLYIRKIYTSSHWLLMIKIFVPLANFAMSFNSDNDEPLLFSLIIVNVLIACFTGFLFIYHFRNVIKGKITYEKRKNIEEYDYDMGWKLNIEEVFGKYWYLTWILPFIRSPLPGNGMQWQANIKQN